MDNAGLNQWYRRMFRATGYGPVEAQRRADRLAPVLEGGVVAGASETQVAAEPAEFASQQQPVGTDSTRGRLRRVHAPAAVPDKYKAGAAALESSVDTGAIAWAPVAAPVPSRKRARKQSQKQSTHTERRAMSQRRYLGEDNQNGVAPLPGGGLKGKGHKMDSPTGDGVAERRPTKMTIGKFDTEMKDLGKEWPRKHSDNLAMGAPPGGQEGDHESKPGKAEDGYLTPLGREWPDPHTNTGSGVAEPFGNSYEGAELDGGSGPKGFDVPEPDNDDEFDATETIGETWSPELVGRLMESDNCDYQQLQQYFDQYARQASYICLEEFSQLLHAHGLSNSLDEDSLLVLMAKNQEYMFHEGRDATGRFWAAEAAQRRNPVPRKGARRDNPFTADQQCDQDCMEWVEIANQMNRLMAEGQASRRHVTRALQASFNVRLDQRQLDECSDQTRARVQRVVEHFGLKRDPRIQALKEASPNMSVMGPAAAGATDYVPDDQNFDEVGFGPDVPAEPGVPEEFPEDDYDQFGEPGMNADQFADPNSPDPAMMADQGEFDPGFDGMGYEDEIGAGDLPDLGAVPGAAQSPTQPGQPTRPMPGRGLTGARPGMESRRRSRRPLNEELEGAGHQMDQEGTAVLSTELSHDHGLPDDDVEMEELHGQNLLGVDQVNSGDGQTEFEHGGLGKLEGTTAIEHNVRTLSQRLQQPLREAARALPGYQVRYALLVQEQDGRRNRTSYRARLAEAITDAEELLQLFGPQRVVLEATYSKQGQRPVTRVLRLPAVASRAPLATEGRALFRFTRVAEAFAGQLMREGRYCRLARHNWGMAVVSDSSPVARARAFRQLAKGI